MTGRIEQIPELFQEQLGADGYDAEDIEQVRRWPAQAGRHVPRGAPANAQRPHA